MTLEDSNGNMVDSPTPEQIVATLREVGGRADHCTLHLPGDSFVQAAGGSDQLFVQYGDGGELMESTRNDLDFETVARMFVDAMEGRTGWKTDYAFTSAGGGDEEASDASPRPGLGGLGRLGGLGAAGTGAAGGGQGGGGSLGGQSMKDQLLNSVKREVNREVSRGVGGLVRKVIRSVSGR